MNKVFKKKAPGGAAAAEGLSVNSDALKSLSNVSAPQLSPDLKKSSTSRWKKGKKPIEQKPAFDLAAVLPSNDDFRTSLLMPNLSARFSMLREQDDPTSLVGKASDDSVLQPRRKSRMQDFGFGASALGDIAEVSSIRGSFRPPFADADRQGSFTSEEGYASDTGGSVMSRSRPGEGNNLFGGRQKIYRIANGANGSARSLGRAVYEDDIGVNAFGRYRQRERDESQFSRPSNDSQGFDFGLDQHEPSEQYEHAHFMNNDSAKDLSHSPSLSSYDKKRSTTSSTARSEARSSTAATSIASQSAASPAVAPTTGPGAPHHVPPLERSNTKSRRLYEQGLDQHMREEQTSNLSRLNSIQRQRTNGKASPPFLHNTRSVGSSSERSAQPAHSLRTQSPPLSGPLTHFGAVQKANSGTPSPAPSSPADLDPQFDLQQALDPSDRGKATALGAFNRPKQAFDEHQYLERQKQLQRSHSTVANKNHGAVQQRSAELEQERDRSGSDASNRSRSQSTAKKNDLKSYTVFQSASKAAPAEQKASRSPLPDTHRTFFGNIHASDSEDDDESGKYFHQPESGQGGLQSKWQPTVPSVLEHPALRAKKSKPSLAERMGEGDSPQLTSKSPIRAMLNDTARPNDSESGSTQVQSQPLGSIMHHLRQKSNASSVYPDGDFHHEDIVPELPEMPSSIYPSDPLRGIGHGMDYENNHNPNTWDLRISADHSPFDARESRSSISPIEPSSNGLGLETSNTPISPLHSESRAPHGYRDGSFERHDAPSWQQELYRQHNRDVSSATQQERDAFANELAARRNAIRENIKSMVERDGHSRENSPAPPPVSATGPFKGLGMLRSKASGESISTMRDQQLKSAKAASGVSSEKSAYSLELSRARGNSSPRPPLPTTAQHPALQQQQQQQQQQPPPPPVQEHPAHRSRNFSSNRSRSSSTATTGRPRSRTGTHRDDLEKASVEGASSFAIGYDVSALVAREFSPQVSPRVGVGAYDVRNSDENKNLMTGYFESNTITSNPRTGGAAAAASAVFNPVRPMPVANSYSQNAVPPLSGTSTPMNGGSKVAAYMPPLVTQRSGTLKKKSISKADISEPTLISSTSNVDTVDLPEGASLKNGMEEDSTAPPIPPINPRRRGGPTRNKFLGGISSRVESPADHSTVGGGVSRISSPDCQHDTAWSASGLPSAVEEFRFPASNVVRIPARTTQQLSDEFGDSPTIGQFGFDGAIADEFQHSGNGVQLERAQRSQQHAVGLDGAMF